MSEYTAKITHLFHSGFIVETENHTLVFDYFNPRTNSNSPSSGLLNFHYFAEKDNVFVFVSHSHSDHYTPEIFKWQSLNPNIKYILSDDVKAKDIKPNYYFMKKYEELKIDKIKIKTYGTTDRGLSFLVKVDGLSIFHSGDLNWWHWKDDSPQVQAKEERDFKDEIEKIKDEKIDIAFVPVDPRLEEFYYLAGEYFARTIKPNLLVPMHFGDKFYITEKFKKKISNLYPEIPTISNIMDVIIF